MSDSQPTLRFDLNTVITIVAFVLAAASAIYSILLSVQRDSIVTAKDLKTVQNELSKVADLSDGIQSKIRDLQVIVQDLGESVEANRDAIDVNDGLIRQNKSAAEKSLSEISSSLSDFAAKSEFEALEDEFGALATDLANHGSRVSVYDLGDVYCDAPKTIPVPDGTTDDWVVFGINPLVNSGVDNASRGDNAIYRFVTEVENNREKTAWDVRFVVEVNYNTKTSDASAGNCNQDRHGRLFQGEISRTRVIAIRK